MLNKKLYNVKRTRDGETTALGKYLLAADANAPKDMFQKILHMKEDVYATATVKGTPDGGYDIFDKDTQYILTPIPMDENFWNKAVESKSEKGAEA